MALGLLPVILASLLRLAVATTNGTGGNESCTPARCGDLSITYPFSLGGTQPLYCGYPSFELTCDGDRAYLTRAFREHLFRVDNISYDNNSLVVTVGTTFAGDEICHIPDFNVSSDLALFPLNISRTNKNLTFVYNCEVPRGEQLSQLCANHTMGAYISERPDGEGSRPQWVQTNCSSVSVPVRGSGRDYERLISEGFLLEWPPMRDCDACTGRGGECRFVELAFQCACPDGRLCSNSSATSRDRRQKHNIKLILIVALSAPTSLILTCLVWIMYRRKKKHIIFIQKYAGNGSNIEEILKGYDSLVPKRYKYSELKKITGSFKDKLGEGGYGMVFKGNLEDGRKVAVKLLKGSKGNGEEFLNEVVSIRRTSHVNIVNLLGFCLHGSKRALIYEYMANGSLEKYIYSEESKMAIGWEKLRQIAIGIARGLEYLHRGCNTRIIHFDIKPHNMLLDEDFCPKIADFGLAKVCHLKDSALSMAEARGTIGFIAPEVFSRGFGVVSTKSDVYSYGMMLLEMVGGRKNVKENTENSSEAYFPNWIYDRLVKDLGSNEVTCETEEIARQMTLVGLWCIQTTPGNRPSMSRVIEMLGKNINELEIPPKPFLSCPSVPSYFSS
ncbi:LEAF RUST 10 DISEASE-RESISTANCE LOCUS RECEPTOR-LIKE PROTEIN KINASE-like 2.1 [Phragmites australis]|uniref:LEAF RUST 10 DISEASE-RESISTANCE LOCUS RECEPTOR-LIKE PROTEIN KINASE-like 2.1 n=1 Tax=Phragmites australis TaxID=29695 RepID=UPI002D772D42|nr:LEAF RUST 10 DISEASE-RESISTANCE LOCUS RECEPTOR-LIKE PROTEIN KINASE-like 2.1 [Phragmites australis]